MGLIFLGSILLHCPFQKYPPPKKKEEKKRADLPKVIELENVSLILKLVKRSPVIISPSQNYTNQPLIRLYEKCRDCGP